MRVRWDFLFECTGIRFDRIYKYQAQISNKQAETFGLPAQGFDALITIEPDEESYNPMVDQTGKLKIILPGNNIQTRDLARWLSQYIAQQSMFLEHKMHIIYGIIVGEHLPDMAEEAEQLGDTPFFSEAHIVEVESTMVEEDLQVFHFDPDKITKDNFRVIERGDIQSEEDIQILIQMLFFESECKIYYYSEKDLSIDELLHVARDRGDILMRKIEFRYYRHPNFRRDYIRIPGKDSKGEKGAEFIRTELELSARKRTELELWQKIQLEESFRQKTQQKQYQEARLSPEDIDSFKKIHHRTLFFC